MHKLLFCIFLSFTSLAADQFKDLSFSSLRYEFGFRGKKATLTLPNGETKVLKDNLDTKPSQIHTILKYDLELKDKTLVNISIRLPRHYTNYKIKPEVYTVTFLYRIPGQVTKIFNIGYNTLQLQFPLGGERVVLTRIRRGDDHDMSEAFMGNKPSKIIEKGMFNDNDLWIYDSTWGDKEAYRTVDSPEMIKYYDMTNKVLIYMNKHLLKAYSMTGKEIIKVSNNSEILKLVQAVANWSLKVNFEDSKTHKAVIDIKKEFSN